MKKILIVLLLICSLSLSSCDKTIYYYEFRYGYEDIVEIKIVDYYDGRVDENNRYVPDYDVIKEIDVSRTQEVCEDILQLEFTRHMPFRSAYGIGIMIVWETGEHDVITSFGIGGASYDSEGSFGPYGSFFACHSKEKFNALIDKYTEGL